MVFFSFLPQGGGVIFIVILTNILEIPLKIGIHIASLSHSTYEHVTILTGRGCEKCSQDSENPMRKELSE